jgi:uncharacterized membrane protein
MPAALPIGDCIKFGWETFKKRPGILIGAFALVILVSAIPGILSPHPEVVQGQPPPPPTPFAMVMALVSIVVNFLVTLGLTNFSLRAHDNIETVTIGDLWNPAPIWRFLGAELLMALVFFAAVLLLAIPIGILWFISDKLAIIVGLPLALTASIILGLGLFFAPYLVVDRGMQPVASLKESWRITDGNKWRLFLLWLALLGVFILGMLALFVGLLVSVPITLLAVVHAYRYLQTAAGPAPA